MIVGYARISTKDQSYSMQIEALKKAGCERIFQETASGATRNRPALNELLHFVRSGDKVIVWKLDRFARSIKQLLETIEILDQKHVEFQSLTEIIDTGGSSPMGRLVIHILGSLYEFERSLINERVRTGIETAKQQGRIGGRPRKLTNQDIIRAQQMLSNPSVRVSEVIQSLHTSPSTFYRYMGHGGRKAFLEREL